MLSTVEAEYVAMAEGSKEGRYIRAMLEVHAIQSGRHVHRVSVDRERAKAMAEDPHSPGRSTSTSTYASIFSERS